MATSDGFEAIKPEVIVETSLALLEREVILPNLMWKDAAGDFRGAKDDTISIRLPAYAVANRRALRSADARVRSKLHERKVDVTLDTDLQIDIPITDEELTLDIRNFMRDVISPALRGIVRGYEDVAAELMSGATYENEVTIDTSEDEGGYNALVDARKFLNDASVPLSDRFAVVGSTVEASILKSKQLAHADTAGDNRALREAEIGRLAGFTVLVAPGLPPEEGYVFHRTAYALNTRAPFVPDGAPWGASMSEGGFAIRVVQVLDPTDIVNIVATDAWVGASVVTDNGEIDDNGKFVPSVDPADGDDLFVRAVKLSLPAS